MKALSLIIQREYAATVKTKAFIITTILMPIIMIVMITLPSFLMKLGNDDIKKIYVLDRTGIYYPLLESSDKYQFENLKDDEAAFPRKNNDGAGQNSALLTIDAVLNDKPTAATFFSEKQKPPRELTQYINEVLTNAVKNKTLNDYTAEMNVDKQVADSINKITTSKASIKITTKQWDETGAEKDTKSDAVSYIGMGLTFLMFFFIVMNGSMVMQSVVEEKTNKIVEVIISSTKPFNLMMGKIIAVALTGLTQLVIWIVVVAIGGGIVMTALGVDAATLSTMASGSGDPQQMAAMTGADPNMQLGIKALVGVDWIKVISSFIIYFIGGYLLYASLFAMFGSAANDSQEAQQFIRPVTVILMLAFYVGFAATRNPEGNLAFWGSIIPFTSPIVMMVRLPFEVPIWEIILSIVLLFASAICSTMLAGKIYRTGILMQGKKTNFKEIFKWLRYK